jgi:hypothetical protein
MDLGIHKKPIVGRQCAHIRAIIRAVYVIAVFNKSEPFRAGIEEVIFLDERDVIPAGIEYVSDWH